jgi:hypothetical protein
MGRRTRRENSHPFAGRRGEFVRVAGDPLSAEVEHGAGEVDHVWLTINAGSFDRIRITINTVSLKNRDVGFDGRVRLGIIQASEVEIPTPGVFASTGLDYSELEKANPVSFAPLERSEVEAVLIQRTKIANRIEAWGDLYLRDHSGLHQVHCRRASCAVPVEVIGRDGALRFHLPNQQSEMLLFKFCGQP